MTRHKTFKRLVRARMEKTSESYTAARAALLTADDPNSGASDGPGLVVSDEVIRGRTGRGWEDWFGLIDEWGGTEHSHKEIAAWIRAEHDTDGWSSQAVTVSYERARHMRAVGERDDGFVVTASKTVAVPIERLYEAFVDESVRRSWLPDAELTERTATKPKSARFDWGEGDSRVVVGLEAKGNEKSTASLAHEKLPDAGEADRMKAYWRERVTTLKEVLER